VFKFKAVIFKKSDMQNIFVYGTLLSTEIVKKLTGKMFKIQAAVLPGYKVYRVEEYDYPAIIQYDGSETNGLIILNVDDSDLEVLSFYEGDEYEKKEVEVTVNGEISKAIAFIWKEDRNLLVNEVWDLVRFEENSLAHYLNVVIPQTLEDFCKK
jgi:gamma-glutamylcyclotransferase (GGCT)/AIG2-like uncharacterized protein YtfP